MNFIARIPCRIKLFLIAGLLACSTTVAALAQVLPLSKKEIVVFWLVAMVGGSIALTSLSLTAGHLLHTVDLLARRAHAIAAGDLSGEPIRVAAHDEIGELAESIDFMQHSLQTMIAGISDTSAALHHQSADLSEAGAQAVSRTGQQSAQVHQAASAMQEMSISIAEVSSHAQSAADQARETASVAREGGATVQEMLAGMNTISASVSQTAETVRRLGDDSEQIIRIVNVIQEIAEKTNLLALNAAIEAARAGEHGRGFAVVAGEVRRLAESTRSATSEISQMIETITGNTRAAVEAMAAGTERVGRGMEITARAGDALRRIVAATGQVESMIAQIATASVQQSTAAQEFSQNLAVINRLGEEQTASASATNALVESVRDGAGRLEASIGRFRVADQPSARRPAGDALLPHAAFSTPNTATA